MPRINPRQKLRHELDLLCRAGVGLTLVAPAVCQLVRSIVGAEACALFRLNTQGLPEGFFHEDSTLAAQELFLNEFENLFIGPHEINVFALAHMKGSRIGHVMCPPASYFRSNTFNLLVRPSGHHHSLDLRIDEKGQTRAVLLLFRGQSQAFSDEDARLLGHVEPYLRRAVADGTQGDAWNLPAQRSGHVLLDASGTQPLMFAGEADVLLRSCLLVGQDVRLKGELNAVPAFIQALCQRLALAERAGQPTPQAREVIDIPAGRLRLVTQRLQSPQGHATSATSPHQILLTLELVQPQRLQMVQSVLALEGLSPLQREIALLAGVGGERTNCSSVIGVSNEALKKHLQMIYRAAGVSDWHALARELRSTAGVTVS